MRIARRSRSRWPLCGAKSFTAVREFAASLTQAQLKGLYFNRKTARHEAPSEPTLRRVLQSCDAEALDRLLYNWLLRKSDPNDPLALDGKTLNGARRKDGTQVHLLSAFLHQQASLRSRWEEKTNEIPQLKRLLEPLDYPGVVTADAMHTQRETARFRVEADSLFIAKNQRSIREDIAALGHDDFPPCRHPAR